MKFVTISGFVSIALQVVCNVSGAYVKFEASTYVITSGLTDSLKLRCSVEDINLTTPTHFIVGRQISHAVPDMLHVNNITIGHTKGSLDEKGSDRQNLCELVRVNQLKSAKVLLTSPSLTAQGTLTPSDPAEPVYIKTTWTNPGEEESGYYFCNIWYVDVLGDIHTFETVAQVISVDPKFEDLVQEIKEFKATLSDLNTPADLAMTKAAPHMEGGVVHCGHADESVDGSKNPSRQITFQQPYTTTPVIDLDAIVVSPLDSGHDYFQYYLSNVTTTGFQIVCLGGDKYGAYYLLVRWTSNGS